MFHQYKYQIIGLLILTFSVALIIITDTEASPTEAELKVKRLEEIRKDIEENSTEYQSVAPLAAKSRSECILMEAREGQLKYLNAQNNKLREEEQQLQHDLKLLGVDFTTGQ